MFFCYFIWRIVINLLSLQRQNESSGYPGRIPRGQDYIDTTHLKSHFSVALLLSMPTKEDMRNIIDYSPHVKSFSVKMNINRRNLWSSKMF